jgi:hypothetical protein
MTTTMLLDRDNWDLCLSTTGDLAIASEPYSQAQDIAAECRLFAGEAWYDTTRGIAYFAEVLGQFQPVQLLKQQLAAAAARVPGVAAVQVYLDAIDGRSVTGQVQFSTDQGPQVLTL